MSSSSLIGQTLGNKYRIIELLGKGGMATVYKGYQEEIDRFVAIKVLPPHPGQDAEFVERFRLEARTIARLQHPHILPVYDYGTEGDILYLAIAYVEGGSLGDKIDSGPMPLKTVESYLREIASALDYAHRRGIVHRDIKPDNILINSEGYTLMSDFGIAKLLSGESKLTATGGMVGTPAYMAPEQAQGVEVGPAADIYALGVVAYEMITGKQPYVADTPLQVVMKHVTDPVPRITEALASVPAALENVMLRVLAKNPADRYPTATAFVEDFSRAIAGQTVEPPTITVSTNAMMPDPPETMRFTSAPQGTVVGSTTQSMPAPASTNNTLLILGGLTIIALLVIAIVALVIFALNQNNASGADPTVTAVAVQNTTAATQAIAGPPTAAPQKSFGKATFSTARAIGDTLTMQAQDWTPTSPGESYVVWLMNTENNDMLGVGTVPINALGSGTLTYTDPDGRFLLGLYNAIGVSREASMGDAPTGEVVYNGSYPLALAHALTSILSASEDGLNGGSLADGTLGEAELARQHGNLAAGASNVAGLRLHTEHTINILLGTEDDYNGNGRGENPSSSKLGVGHFLDLIESSLDEALAEPDVPLSVQNEAELMRVCVINARHTIDQIIPLQTPILAANDLADVQDDLATSTGLLDVLLQGTDLDGNGRVDPYEGECSLQQIPTFGVLAAVIDIHEGAGTDE